MQNPYKKITASLLLFSHMLTSCYNPNLGMGKQALPTPAGPADKQRQYAGEPHDKYPPKPTSHTFTTADKHPITFTYHNGQWQAAIKEYASNDSWQHGQLPVVFEPGLALEDVVDSNPTEQKLLLHLCPSEENPEQPGYVYVGRAPMPHPQLLRSPAARQTVLPSQVRLAQQQATIQPQQGKTSLQQAQEQPGRQAVLALPSPVQEIGENPRSQGQLPTTPARVISNSLSIPSRETPSQRVVQKQPTSPQGAPSRKALSWRNQHELLPSQRAAQAKRAQSAAMAKPGNQLAQPSQAIVSLTPAHPPSLADKTPPGIASQVLLAQGGHPVRFMHQDGQWQASVRERIGVFSRVMLLPVACEGHGDVAKALAELQAKPAKYTQRRIHVMHTKQIPYVPQFIYLGAQGLQGGGNGAGEASGSGEPQDEPAAGEPEGAQGREPSQPLAALQDLEASLADAFFDAIPDNDTASVTDLLNQDSRLLEKIVARDNGQGAMRERTPLMYAAQLGNQPMVSLLLEQGAQVNQALQNGATPLLIAAQQGHLETVQCLAGHGAAVDQATSDGATPLLIAAQQGHLEVAQCLVEQGAQVNQATNDGVTPLLIAALKGHLEVVQYLVGQGAQVDQANKNGANPLYVAAQEGQLETVQYLVGHGAAVDQATSDGATPLLIAALKGHLETAQYLVAHGAQVNQVDINGVTPLWIAAQNGHLACMRWLLQKGAHANISNNHHTPLHETASSRHINKNRKAVAAILVQEGKVPIDPEDTAGDTPLSWAAEGGDLEMVQFFVEKGANIHHVAHSDRSTPLLLAAKNGHQGVVAYLVEQGANIEAMNNKGATALWIAAQAGHLAVVQYLQEKDANIEAADKDGKKPLWIAIEKGHPAVAQFLGMQQLPYVPKVCPDEQGLKGGMDRASEPSGNGEPQDEPAAVGKEQAKHEPSRAVKIFKGEGKQGVDLREYGSWYDDSTLEYLARTIKQSQHHPPMVIFHHHPPNKNMSFANQITQLQLLKHSKSKKAALFLCHEPVVGHHYLFGMLYEHRLILLNPVGASDHQNLYEALAAVKQQGIVEKIYLSRTRIQQEEELVSCGPISAEWMLHYGAMDEEGLGKVVDELCSAGEKQEKQVGQGQEATMLPYQEVEVSPWLPASLRGLVHTNPASYKGELVKLRRNHLARLEQKRASELEEDRDEQVWFSQVVLERKDILSLEASEAPQGLAKRAEQAKFKPTSGQERTQLARDHDIHRASGLTESQGPSELERAQIEAKRLKEQIAEQYSRLPQATEEGDSKIVHELTTHLARLLELEGFCAPAQGDDGAKEYIARLREEHRTRWSQTAYGAAVSKELTALLAQAYGQELKRVASERLVDKASEGIASLAKVLGQLAALHQEQGEETGDLAYYTDAAILYQNVLRVCEEEMKEVDSQAAEALGYQAQIAAAYRGLAKIREALLASGKEGKAGVVAQGGMRIAELQEEIAKDKQVLQALRKDADRKVEDLEAALSKQGTPEEVLAAEKAYIQGSRALFADIAKGVREFLARLYQESEQALGPAPCKYTVMGLGSMALAQMTPYSDLAFAILIEEAQDEATAQEYKAYLRQLTHLVHCRVINLGETTIPISKYGMSLDHLSKRGIHFDVGGKTPLGRKDKPYDLIQPVAGMLRYLKNEENKIAHIDKNLPYILESTCYVHGDGGLYKDYEAMKEPFLQEAKTAEGLPIHKARALKRLLEGVVEWDYSKPGEAKAKPKQPGNLAAFEPQLGPDDAGRLYDVKQAIYRLPDRLLYGLAMYYGLRPESGWDAVEQLAEKKVIGVGEKAQEAAHHLQYAVSFATMLRLKTYLHHDQQAECVTMLRRASQQEAQQEVSKLFVLPPASLQAGGSLFKYYYTALPLHRKMEAFFKELGSRQQVLALLESNPALDPEVARKLATFFEKEGKVAPSKEAGFFQAEAFYDDSDKTGGDIYRRLLDHEAAKGCYERALAIHEQAYGPEHPQVATSLNSLGKAWNQLGEPKQAIEYLERALAIHEQVYGPEHPDVATSLNNLGSAWNQLGDHKQAIAYYEQALPIDEQAYGPEHPHVATSLNNLGFAWDKLGDPKQAISYHEQAFHIMKKAYGEDHPSTQTIKHNIEEPAGRLEHNVAHQTNQFIQACVAGNEGLATSMPMRLLGKDLYDAQGNPLICWMAQHAMMATLAQVLELGWDPNLPNARQVYPLHYAAMKNPGLASRLLQAGAHPFVQTAKGNTPAQVARNKGNVATLAVLLPSVEELSFKDAAAFEESYQAYKQRFSTCHQDTGELLAALGLALQLGDADLTLVIQAKQASQNLLRQLIDQYPLAADAIPPRFESMLKGTVDE